MIGDPAPGGALTPARCQAGAEEGAGCLVGACRQGKENRNRRGPVWDFPGQCSGVQCPKRLWVIQSLIHHLPVLISTPEFFPCLEAPIQVLGLSFSHACPWFIQDLSPSPQI